MNRLLQHIKSTCKPKGLSDFEIKRIETLFGIKLPNNYSLFLKEMGSSAGDFMKGEDIFYNRIFDLRESAEEILLDDGHPIKLKQEDFVFYGHQGYIFAFFNTLMGDNGNVYLYMEGDKKIKTTFPNFYFFLSDKFNSYLKWKERS